MMKRWIFALILSLAFLLPACGVSPQPDIAAVEEAVPPATATVVVNTPTTEATVPVVEETQPSPVETATNAVEPATQAPEPTEVVVTPTEPAEVPTTETEPEPAVQAEVDWLTVEGKTADNLAFLGNPDAPVTMIDYSDFL
jgi:outer membrane biosynthesis protein TonB